MARPKAGTPEGDAATLKWRHTMVEKYGGVTEKMQEIGSAGGKAGRGAYYQGGFAHPSADPRTAGAKGGKVSRRKPKVVA